MEIKTIFLFLLNLHFITSNKDNKENKDNNNLIDLTQQQLEKYNGNEYKQKYVAIDNIIYDISLNNQLDQFKGKYISIIGDNELLNIIKNLPIIGYISQPKIDLKLTKNELLNYIGNGQILNGRVHSQVFVAINGIIFDVSYSGYHLYGPGGSYHIFAGKDASRALAKMSFEPKDINSSDLSDLTEEEKKSLTGWFNNFQKKYPIVGILIPN